MRIKALATAIALLGMRNAWAIDPALERVAATLQTRAEAGSTDQKPHPIWPSFGRDRMAKPKDPSTQAKIWCETAMVFSDVENLVECARFNLESLKEANNPVPNLPKARINKAQKGLVLLNAAGKLAQQQPVAPALRDRLKRDRACHQEIIRDPANICR